MNNMNKTQKSKTLSIVRNITERFNKNLKIIRDNFNKTNVLFKQILSIRNK